MFVITFSSLQSKYIIYPYHLQSIFLQLNYFYLSKQKQQNRLMIVSIHKVLYLVTATVLICSKKEQSEFRFEQKAYMLPHPQKAEKGGEDAFYAAQNLLVIADGVGGWNAQGIDPSRYSRFLIRAQVYYNEDPIFYDQNPLELIIKSQSKNNYIGSSTMVVLTLHKRELKSCYIGDSGFIVIRVIDQKPHMIYQFTEQQHAFNFPFQLAMKKYNGDDPKISICVSIDIQQGDIIVAGSDGLFDNIFVDQIVATIEDALISSPDQIFSLPKLFAEQSILRGKNDTFSSPFSQRALDLGIDYLGGKLDDTTVIVARIQKVTPQISQKRNQEL